jgi:hypothetical protein
MPILRKPRRLSQASRMEIRQTLAGRLGRRKGALDRNSASNVLSNKSRTSPIRPRPERTPRDIEAIQASGLERNWRGVGHTSQQHKRRRSSARPVTPFTFQMMSRRVALGIAIIEAIQQIALRSAQRFIPVRVDIVNSDFHSPLPSNPPAGLRSGSVTHGA